MSKKSGVIFISFFVILAFIAGIVGVVLLVKSRHGNTEPHPDNLKCEEPYTLDPSSNKCFKLMSAVITRSKEFGLELCHQINGNIIEILDEKTQEGVINFMKHEEVDIWLGVTFNPRSGQWYWPIANQIAKYKNWDSQQKDEGIPMSCAIAKHENNYAWTDSDCVIKDEIYVLCEDEAIII
ncbi:C-type mannose receptor 2 [Lepeophtheirus salmonis]|uniref:C-type mannose receptor 2 n=1 Tax=Lepeophtheirus salmonis TaxID=72036 RepID=UPI001AE55DE2|nr:C-type mannose receptor 2-like [Lepeophtheirus salmonis]